VAYVNYPTYPGWHVREIFREVLAAHGGGADPRTAPAEARELIALFERNGRGGAAENIYAAHLREEAARLRSIPDDVLLHDYLEASSPGLFFDQFVDRLSRRGLEYVGEVKQNPARRRIADQLLAERPQLAEDWLTRERYVDAVHGALARRSVICRAGKPVARTPQPKAIEQLQLRALAVPVVNRGEIQSAAPLPFRMLDGTTLQVADPAVKTLLVSLARAWPGAISFDDLLQVIRATLQLGQQFAAPGSAERQSVLQAALACFSAGLIDLHQRAPFYLPVANERPTATPLARYQARESRSVTNVLHVLVTSLNKVDRVVLSHLNGSRDRAALATVLKAAVTRGVLPDPDADPRAAADAGWHGDVAAMVEQSLAKLTGNALLVG
jgi:hypothetical protein